MPRPRNIRLDDDQNYILLLYLQKQIPIENIRHLLCRRWNISITKIPSCSTIRARLREWGVNLNAEGHGGYEARVNRQKEVNDEEPATDEALIAQIKILMQQGLDSAKILTILRNGGWPDLTKNKLWSIRHTHDIMLKTRPADRDSMAAEAFAIVAEGLESGITADFGDNMAIAWAKAQTDRFIAGPAVKAAIRG
ncbi:hypothetical protein TWF106_000117 [Orbilia oligospora]|uniref:Clr5 domain-containing protein n=1 Tax=Orbilia oligospora TaxID=2813651 RepID=A0A7C8V443_ORBOL|nr:hypothetical protein TWF106_000117 [Orbilia oligospora]